jgi:hypothetical protein
MSLALLRDACGGALSTMAEGEIAKRAMFGDNHEALPDVRVFDPR